MNREELDLRDKQIAELTYEKVPTAEIAKRVGVTVRSVMRAQRRRGIPASIRKMTPEEVAYVEEKLDEGWSLAEVSRTIGRAEGTLSHRFRGRSKWNSSQGQHYRRWVKQLEAL